MSNATVTAVNRNGREQAEGKGIEPTVGDLYRKPFRINMMYVQMYVDTPFTYEDFEHYIRKLPSGEYVLEDTRYVPEFLPPFKNLLPVPPQAARTMQAVRKIEASHYYYDAVSFALVQRVLGDVHTSIKQNKWVDGATGQNWIDYAIEHMIDSAESFGLYGDSNIRVLRRHFLDVLNKKKTYELFEVFERLVEWDVAYRHHLMVDSEGDTSMDPSMENYVEPRYLF
jgi:hypothetical protein